MINPDYIFRGSWGQNGISSDRATSSACTGSVCGITAMAVVGEFPGIGKLVTSLDIGFGIYDVGSV